jgi:arylsulfatase A-like enzyme
VPADMQGRSFVPVLQGKTPKDWRTAFYYQYYEYPSPHHVRPHYGVITDRYKLVHFYATNDDYWELFDLKNDPNELRDVYNDPKSAAIRQNLSQELARLRRELKVPNNDPPRVFGNQPLN